MQALWWTDSLMDRQSDGQTVRWTDFLLARQSDGQTVWWTDSLTDILYKGQTIWWSNNMKDRQSERQTLWWTCNIMNILSLWPTIKSDYKTSDKQTRSLMDRHILWTDSLLDKHNLWLDNFIERQYKFWYMIKRKGCIRRTKNTMANLYFNWGIKGCLRESKKVAQKILVYQTKTGI